MGHGRVIGPAEWKGMTVPDVYFSEAYHSVSALAEPDFAEMTLLEWKDEGGSVWLPLILRNIPGSEYLDSTSAYGYGGPWSEGQPNFQAFGSFFRNWARERRVVTSLLRFHPLVGNVHDLANIVPTRFVGHTATWDLVQKDGLTENMSKSHRKNYRRALRSGLQTRITLRPDDFTSSEFRQLYELSMRRLSARSFYWFSDGYWRSLPRDLSAESILVGAYFEGRLVAGAWCLWNDDYLHFHLSGTTEEGRRLGGAYACRVAAAEWGRDRGLILAHHGGGAGGADSPLLEWKQKFDNSTPLRDYYVGEVIHDPQAFAHLTEDYPKDGFFPPWRSPAARDASDLVRERQYVPPRLGGGLEGTASTWKLR